MIFNEGDLSFLVRKHLHRHLKDFGLVLHLLLNPFYALVVDYISSNIARVGSIPVDLDGGRAEAIKKCEDYLRKGRAVITLQGRGRVDPGTPTLTSSASGTALRSWPMISIRASASRSP